MHEFKSLQQIAVLTEAHCSDIEVPSVIHTQVGPYRAFLGHVKYNFQQQTVTLTEQLEPSGLF